jgi:DNA-binding transcriptional MerR regulator
LIILRGIYLSAYSLRTDTPPQSVQLLQIIITAQAGGFSLDEIRHLLPTAGMEKWNREKSIGTLKHKVEEIELLQRRLRQNKAKLLEVIQYAEKPSQPCGKHAEHLMKKLTPIVQPRVHATVRKYVARTRP